MEPVLCYNFLVMQQTSARVVTAPVGTNVFAWLVARYTPYVQLAAVALLAVVAYASTPFNYWVADDYNYIVPKGLDRVLGFFDPTVATRAFYRPLNWTSWAMDYALWGRSPFGWHITSIILHAITTVVVTLIVYRLFKGWGIATLAGALFAVHPAHPETVSWIGGRADLACGVFYFPAVLFFVMYLDRRQGGKPAGGLYALSLLMAAGAVLGKEMGVTVPLVLILTDLFFFSPVGRYFDLKEWRTRIVPHLPFIAMVGAYAVMRWYLVRAGIVTNTYVGPSLWEPQRLLDSTASNVMLHAGVWGGPAIVPVLPNVVKIGIVLVGVATAVLLVRWLGRTGVYALLWVVITEAPTANLTALRWLYVPSFGTALLVALAVWKLVGTMREGGGEGVTVKRRVGYGLAAIVLAFWGFGVVYQNVLWYRSGEEARSIVDQIEALVPGGTEPATIYFARAPYYYDTVLLFNTGLGPAVSQRFEGRRQIDLHEMEQPVPPDPVVIDALADPPKLKPNAVFLGYEGGRVVRYESIEGVKPQR